MGVHGLTTYLRDNQRHLSKTLILPGDIRSAVDIVVDGWSFIYELDRDSGLPWVYGGEYDRFCSLVLFVVRAWVKLGLRLHFVFDGAYPQLKFSTLVSRLGHSSVQPSVLFFRTSSVSRSSARFLNENRILPPLAYTACLHALRKAQNYTDAIKIHFADEEGDPYAVELAGRLGGYVVGNDSDFVILNTSGYRGYIPMTEMVWYSSAQAAKEEDAMEEDGEFTTVRKSKAKRKVRGQEDLPGVIPPNDEDRTLSVTVYSPEMLAEHLKLPVALLPLLGALVGNDFTTESAARKNGQSLFFEKSLTLPQRIERVASTLQTIISPNPQKNKKYKHPIGSVMDLIDRAVNSLLTRVIGLIGSGEISAIVDRTVEATLQYAIPRQENEEQLWASGVCALHAKDNCPLIPLLSKKIDGGGEEEADVDEDDEEEGVPYEAAREQYLQAYRKGLLSPKIMDILSTGTFWPRMFLENPDYESVTRSISRPIRAWTYAVLDEAVGLPDPPPPEPTVHNTREAQEEDEEDEDELIDVVESDSEDSDARDFLAPLKGELQRLQVNEAQQAATNQPSQMIVNEYVRRGTRAADEAIPVSPLEELLASTMPAEISIDDAKPLSLLLQDERLHVFLAALRSDLPSVRALPPEQLFVVVTVRWIIQILQDRAHESNSRDREKERWTKREVLSLLRAFQNSTTPWPSSINQGASELPPMIDRHIQLTAQVLTTMESIGHLSQALFLSDIVQYPVHHFSGQRFHEFLTGTRKIEDFDVPPGLEEATLAGLDGMLSQERYKKKAKKGLGNGVAATPVNKTSTGSARGGFAVLLDIEG